MASPLEMDRGRIGWWAVAGMMGATIGYVVYHFIGTFVFGVFVYYVTRPIYRRIRRVVRPPSLAAGVSLVLITLPVILLLAYTVAIGIQEFNRLVEMRGVDLGQFESLIAPYVDISRVFADPMSLVTSQLGSDAVLAALRDATAYLGFFGTAALHLFVVIVLGFYLLRDDQRLSSWFERRFGDSSGVLATYLHRVDHDFSRIFFGNILNAVLTGIIGATAYGLLDLAAPPGVSIPYTTLVGLLTGIASLVPVIGIKLVYVPLAGYLFYAVLADPTLLWFPIAFVAISFVVVDVIPDLVLRPYVSGRGLHLGMVMLAYVFGPLLFGWYGIFLGPMLLILIVHFVELILPELLAGTEIEPEPRGRSIITGAPYPSQNDHDGESVDGGTPSDPATSGSGTQSVQDGDADDGRNQEGT
ncbi:MAG: AI-2E family transporter [Halanaeroarchaeum sp.]